jgi:hypothetical protein
MNPLDQLADIAIPEDVSAWPPAIGYWIMLAASLLLIIGIVLFFYKRHTKRLVRKQSLAALQSINVEDHQAMQQIHHVLKTAAQRYLTSNKVLQMQTAEWTSLLLQLYGGKQAQTVCEPLAQLAKWQYDQRIQLAEPQQIKDAAQAWIEKALPPKKGAIDV